MSAVGFSLGLDSRDEPESDVGESQLQEPDDQLHHQLARLQDWDTLLLQLQSAPPSPGSSLLHHLVTYRNVPRSIIDCLSNLASTEDVMQQTPLHLAIQCIPDRTDIIQSLLQAAPETAQQRDVQFLRPIDILCQKIIMAEERSKYRPRNTLIPQDSLWQCVHLLAQASCSSPTPQPLVHACLQATDVPWALTERAMKRHMDQLQLFNAEGDLPLHIVARLAHDNEDDDDDEDDDVLEPLIALYPGAASRGNSQGLLPLDLAIASGRKWTTGIALLLEAHPAGLERRGVALRVYPLILEKLVRQGRWNMVFGILQAKPELFR